MTKSQLGRVPNYIDKEVRALMTQHNMTYPRALEEYINRKRGIIKWDL